jgi:uncharacterized protein (TIRG00374 family)
VAAESRSAGGQDLPRIRFTRGRVLAVGLVAVSVALFVYFVVPKLLGLRATWRRIDGGDPGWLGLGAGLEVLSFAGYIALFRAVFAREQASAGSPGGWRENGSRLGWRESYQITLASLAATRLFAAAGAGGMALTAWALRRAGRGPRTVAAQMLAFLALLYGVYMAAFVIAGLGLYLGVFAGPAPFAITVGPAVFGAVVIVAFLALTMLPEDLERWVSRRTGGGRRAARALRWLAALSVTAAVGVRIALELVRRRPRVLLGALSWWGFDIAVLWACFYAFGAPPAPAVIVLAYFLGMLGNALPLPGGIGGVDGGMIGAFTAFGVNVDLAVVAVLAYRALAFWLPTLPGAVAYLQLRRTMQRWEPAASGAAVEAPVRRPEASLAPDASRAGPAAELPSYT